MFKKIKAWLKEFRENPLSLRERLDNYYMYYVEIFSHKAHAFSGYDNFSQARIANKIWVFFISTATVSLIYFDIIPMFVALFVAGFWWLAFRTESIINEAEKNFRSQKSGTMNALRTNPDALYERSRQADAFTFFMPFLLFNVTFVCMIMLAVALEGDLSALFTIAVIIIVAALFTIPVLSYAFHLHLAACTPKDGGISQMRKILNKLSGRSPVPQAA